MTCSNNQLVTNVHREPNLAATFATYHICVPFVEGKGKSLTFSY